MVVSLEKHGGQSDYSVAGEEATWLIDHGESTYVEQGWIYDARKNDFAPRLAGAYLQFKKLDNAVLFKLIFG